MRTASNVHDFGLCSPDPRVPPREYDLDSHQDTIIRFRTSIGHGECEVQLIFHPFRHNCNLTYHWYEIRCAVRRGTPRDTEGKQSIISIVHWVYNRYFSTKAGYKLDVLESELQFSDSENDVPGINKRSREDDEEERPGQRSRRTYSLRSSTRLHPPRAPTPVDDTANPPPTRATTPVDDTVNPSAPSTFTFVDCNLLDGRLPIRTSEKPVAIDRWVPESGKVTICEVKKAYEAAVASGHLKCTFIPRPLTDKDLSSTFNPYHLSASAICAALLETDRLDQLDRRLTKIKDAAPVATLWKKRIENYNLTPISMLEIFRAAFGYSTANKFRSSPANPSYGTLDTILMTAQYFFNQANALEKEKAIYNYAVAIGRLTGHALMQVFYHTRDQLDRNTKQFSNVSTDLQKRYCNLASAWGWIMANLPGWRDRELQLYLILVRKGGERKLRELLQPSLPAAAGEVVAFLGSDAYTMPVSESERVPGIVAVVRYLLRPDIKNVDICRALGHDDKALDDFDERYGRWFKSLTSEPETVPKSPEQGTHKQTSHSPIISPEFNAGSLSDGYTQVTRKNINPMWLLADAASQQQINLNPPGLSPMLSTSGALRHDEQDALQDAASCVDHNQPEITDRYWDMPAPAEDLSDLPFFNAQGFYD